MNPTCFLNPQARMRMEESLLTAIMDAFNTHPHVQAFQLAPDGHTLNPRAMIGGAWYTPTQAQAEGIPLNLVALQTPEAATLAPTWGSEILDRNNTFTMHVEVARNLGLLHRTCVRGRRPLGRWGITRETARCALGAECRPLVIR